MIINPLPERFLVNTAQPQAPVLLLAHGAGALMDSPFMEVLARELVQQGVSVVRFEFPYMAQRRTGGSKRPAPKADTLIDFFREQIQLVTRHIDCPLFIGGKSMGARIGTMTAAQQPVLGALGFGYPFHAPGKPAGNRVDHLADLDVPVQIIQGTRDPFGKPEDVQTYALAASVNVHWLQTADHDFKPLKASSLTQAQCIAAAAEQAAQFIKNVNENLS